MQALIRRLVSFLRDFLRRRFGIHVVRKLAHGQADCHDILLHGGPIRVVFDVGANIGQSARKFAAGFPGATIHCFEPVSSTHAQLLANVQGLGSVFCHRLALGCEPGRSTIYLTRHSVMNSLVKPAEVAGSEEIEVTTLDRFCHANGVSRIDLLKVDAEGFDLEVLRGGAGMLSSGSVRFVLVETGFHPGSSAHIQFEESRSHLASLGFSVFGFYDQQLEWSGRKRLRFSNVCFVHDVSGSSSTPPAGRE